MATSLGKLTVELSILPVLASLPHVTFDGGLWHCDGRIVAREYAVNARDEILFWLAIHEAEKRLQEHEQRED